MLEKHELYVIRHGVAEERGEKWPDDAKRPLTEDGIDRLRKEARGLMKAGVNFDLILTSPLTRARQTAEVLGAGLDPRPALTNVDSLSPDGSYAAVMSDLGKHSRKERIALVGHEPSIGELAARLIGSRHPIPFKKGAVCCIEVDALPPADPGSLKWFLSPKLLRALAKG
jgi:phosphohistidine phosphatase